MLLLRRLITDFWFKSRVNALTLTYRTLMVWNPANKKNPTYIVILSQLQLEAWMQCKHDYTWTGADIWIQQEERSVKNKRPKKGREAQCITGTCGLFMSRLSFSGDTSVLIRTWLHKWRPYICAWWAVSLLKINPKSVIWDRKMLCMWR